MSNDNATSKSEADEQVPILDALAAFVDLTIDVAKQLEAVRAGYSSGHPLNSDTAAALYNLIDDALDYLLGYEAAGNRDMSGVVTLMTQIREDLQQ